MRALLAGVRRPWMVALLVAATPLALPVLAGLVWVTLLVLGSLCYVGVILVAALAHLVGR
jgi:hypothetical protein